MPKLNEQENKVKGVKGYAKVTNKFIEATEKISFKELHKDFLPFIPKKPSWVLDLGAGIGRDALELADMGHKVAAVEPLKEFRDVAKKLYDSFNITWINDSLPKLKLLDVPNQFDFILASGVWHHLDNEEQRSALLRVTELLNLNGIFAVSLRHGPAGSGTHIFPTNGEETIKWAEFYGLSKLLCLRNQPSLMKNKENVTWTRLVFTKIG